MIVRHLGLQDYGPVWRAMQEFVAAAGADAAGADDKDEIWLLSHRPVFTLGQAGKAGHILDAGAIPVVQTDRGGQVTYHGPGQLVVYLLLNMRRRRLGVRNLVEAIQNAVMATLAGYGIAALARPGAPGVYVGEAKIAALGLRIKNGWSYHGLSLNVDMDLQPFARINPCGYQGLAVTQVADLIEPPSKACLNNRSPLEGEQAKQGRSPQLSGGGWRGLAINQVFLREVGRRLLNDLLPRLGHSPYTVTEEFDHDTVRLSA